MQLIVTSMWHGISCTLQRLITTFALQFCNKVARCKSPCRVCGDQLAHRKLNNQQFPSHIVEEFRWLAVFFFYQIIFFFSWTILVRVLYLISLSRKKKHDMTTLENPFDFSTQLLRDITQCRDPVLVIFIIKKRSTITTQHLGWLAD